MKRSWIRILTVAFMGLSALVIAAPLRSRLGADWMPAINFSLGVTLTTFAFFEFARTLVAWSTRAATLRWIGSGLIMAVGFFVCGAAFILHARETSLDWTAILGIGLAVGGSQFQNRASHAPSV